ncbi:SPFH domain-containing protein [Mucilaginibacter myungsuensis]|uniref:Flotillin family protein n=1 Tax=Mucilaginibacter myungsuensis TaxID=649104 RepID=A0A929PXV6_9SPHI|nr:SPFH domain-containing protein [Mucilaginibacter myungsuensis]MBE9663576.1 flotillin family protein [Mucilaginibacter myungsuensis]MDN3599100.1 SPFH domain-containing protein [Mucilaginibacter myungsuensis]
MDQLMFHLWWIVPVVAAAVLYKIILNVFFGMVIVPDDRIGLVVKKFTLYGDTRMPDGRIIATNGEAGMQAQPLAPGLYWRLWPWQYEITMQSFTIIEQGKLGLVKAKDGAPMDTGRVLGRPVDCDKFQDARAFLEHKGQRGPQAAFLTPGSYRINTFLFDLEMVPVTQVHENKVGIVTTLDGEPLDKGEIAGGSVVGHRNYQDPMAFIQAGGKKGLQEDVILAGTYYLNPWFVLVEQVEMMHIPIGFVGVVNSFVGPEGKDTSGMGFKHGNIVAKGEKGVWNDPLDPGKHPVNIYTHTVEIVPTTNIVLNWANSRTESHELDKNLCTISVRSSDGFTFNLDVSQIIHIPHNEAPKVIARFGNMKNLVSQVLEPTIANYFRNSAQKSGVIEFLTNRSQRQEDAKNQIAGVLSAYNVEGVDTLIGDIVPPAALMKTLTDRKIAEEERMTYEIQRSAEIERKEFESARAGADMQPEVVKSTRQVEINTQMAAAKVASAKGDAESKTINAKADAEVQTINSKANALATEVNGNADAGKIKAIGLAEAEVTKQKTEAMGTEQYAVVRVAEALAQNGVKLVPEILVSGQGGGGNGIIDALIGAELFKKLKEDNAKQ